jgi:hypothetical protein
MGHQADPQNIIELVHETDIHRGAVDLHGGRVPELPGGEDQQGQLSVVVEDSLILGGLSADPLPELTLQVVSILLGSADHPVCTAPAVRSIQQLPNELGELVEAGGLNSWHAVTPY